MVKMYNVRFAVKTVRSKSLFVRVGGAVDGGRVGCGGFTVIQLHLASSLVLICSYGTGV